MSLLSTLSIGARALKAFQRSIQTTSHNISNANTPGYTRQRAVLQTALPDKIGGFQVGRGMDFVGVERIRDNFIDTQINSQKQGFGKAQLLGSVYAELEAVFNEVEGTGFQEQVNQFWSAWEELTNDPSDAAVRSNLRTRSVSLAGQFQQYNTQLNDLKKSLNVQVVGEVTDLNSKLTRFSDLNVQIADLTARGQTPSESLDERDLLMKDISQTMDVTFLSKKDGKIHMHLNGTLLVDDAGAREIQTVPRSGDPLGLVDLVEKTSQRSLVPSSGKMAGLLEARDTIVSDYSTRINDLASGMITKVNDLHKKAMGLDGTNQITASTAFTGTLAANTSFILNGTTVNLFAGDDVATIAARINTFEATTGVRASVSSSKLVLAPAPVNPQTVDVTDDSNGVMLQLGIMNNFFSGTGSSDMTVSQAVLDDLDKIAASSNGAPGDNSTALAINALRESLNMKSNTMTFDGFYQSMITDLGTGSQDTIFLEQNQTLLLNQLEEIRESVSGVSLDEEVINLMQFQKSYEMAARVISTADEMLETLLTIR